MKSLTRTIIVLVVINLMMGNFAPAQDAREQRIAEEPAQPSARRRAPAPTPEPQPEPIPVPTPVAPTPQVTSAPRPTFTISGRTGLSGVIMQGLPGRIVVTDSRGYYTAKVPYGFSGTVKPKKDGINFEPPEMRYARVMHDLTNQDYIAKKLSPPVMFRRAGSRQALVISPNTKAEYLAAMTEDLQVMCHIFDERFIDPQEVTGVFADFGDFFGRGSRSTEAIYIHKFGVLFLMEINFAFSPEPKAQEKEDEENEDVDPVWQQARQKIFSPQGFDGSDFAAEEQYSADKIDQLKTELTRTLKHVANIRFIEEDETVILTVIGKARQPGGMYGYQSFRNSTPRTGTSRSRGRSSSSSRGDMGSYGGGMGGGYGVSGRMSGGMGGMAGGGMGGFGGGMMMGGGMIGGMGAMYSEDYNETGSALATVLIIVVEKSDVDDFARGNMNFEQFQKKVEIFTY